MDVARLAAMVRQLQGEGWHEVGAAGEPPFLNGWANFGSSYDTLAFRMPRPDVVAFKGSAKGGAPTGPPMFTLPVGYRPLKDRRLTGVVASGGLTYAALILVTPVR
jgi:hypothetical protein